MKTWIIDFYDGETKLGYIVVEAKRCPTQKAKNMAWAARRKAEGREVTYSIELMA